jgi:hypothetical protein
MNCVKQLKKSSLSPEKAINIVKTIYAVKIKRSITKKITYLPHIKTEKEKIIRTFKEQNAFGTYLK